MEFSYGNGIYIEAAKRIEGKIVLGEHKVFLKGVQGDLAQTFIPLDKIERIRKCPQKIEFYVRLSVSFQYIAMIQGEKKYLLELLKDIVQRRGFKKKFLRNEWVEEVV